MTFAIHVITLADTMAKSSNDPMTKSRLSSIQAKSTLSAESKHFALYICQNDNI